MVEALPAGQNNGHTGHNPYEFIMSPPQPKRAPFKLSLSGIALLGGGIVLILIVLALVLGALAPKGITPGLTTAAEQQQEIVRIATAAAPAATGQDTRNFVSNVEISVSSSQTQVLAYLAAHGTKLNSKTLALKQNAQTDTLLTNAATAGTYDSTVASTLVTELKAYAQTLNTTYKQASNSESKALLQKCYAAAAALIAQGNSLQTSN